MSSLVIEVCAVDDVRPHPDADKMAIAKIKGWEVCVAKDAATGEPWCKKGQAVVYFPPDSVLPPALAEKHGVAKYAAPVKAEDGSLKGYRIRVARLRSFPSYGFAAEVPDPTWAVGRDVAAELGVTKYEPPARHNPGEAELDHPAFHRYFKLEHWRNFPEVLRPGERIRLTEKIHGMNWRGGLIRVPDADGKLALEWMAGSHDVRLRQFVTKTRKRYNPDTGETEAHESYQVESQFWVCLDNPVRAMLRDLAMADGPPDGWRDVVVFGELFGAGVQKDMAYGHTNGMFSMRAFDVTVNGRWLSLDEKDAAMKKHNVPAVPTLYDGPYSPGVVEQHVSGPTTICAAADAGPFKFREGIVVTAAEERQVPTEKKVFERAALKVVSFEYLERKGGSEYH